MTEVRIDSASRVAAELAGRILSEVDEAARAGRPYLLGCPTGRSPAALYSAIAERLAAHPQPLGHLVLVMMDEYLVQGPEGLGYVRADAHNSCRRFAEEEIRALWNAVLPEGMRLPAGNLWFADPAVPEAFDRRITAAGGLDFFILASGASDGHVAFNPPGTPKEAPTRIVTLSEETRRDNMATFPDFTCLDEVPTHGISVGISTIAGARAGAMLLSGAGKREAFRRITAREAYDSDWPATVIHLLPDRVILADQEAAGTSDQPEASASA